MNGAGIIRAIATPKFRLVCAPATWGSMCSVPRDKYFYAILPLHVVSIFALPYVFVGTSVLWHTLV